MDLQKLAQSLTTLPPLESVDQMRMMGKQAAAAYLSGEADDLTTAVVRTLRESGVALNPSQVLRVAEITNQQTWDNVYRVQKNTEGQFVPADPNGVLDALQMRPEVYAATSTPVYDTDRLGETPDFAELARMLGVTDASGQAIPAFDETRSLRDEVTKTASAVELLQDIAGRLKDSFDTTLDRFYSEYKQAVLNDEPVVHIHSVLKDLVQDEMAQNLSKYAHARLAKEGVSIDNSREMIKSASAVVPDYGHPLFISASAVGEIVSTLEEVKRKLGEAEILAKATQGQYLNHLGE